MSKNPTTSSEGRRKITDRRKKKTDTVTKKKRTNKSPDCRSKKKQTHQRRSKKTAPSQKPFMHEKNRLTVAKMTPSPKRNAYRIKTPQSIFNSCMLKHFEHFSKSPYPKNEKPGTILAHLTCVRLVRGKEHDNVRVLSMACCPRRHCEPACPSCRCCCRSGPRKVVLGWRSCPSRAADSSAELSWKERLVQVHKNELGASVVSFARPSIRRGQKWVSEISGSVEP